MNRGSISRVFIQHFLQNIINISTYYHWEHRLLVNWIKIALTSPNLIKNFVLFSWKGENAVQHLMQDDTERPDIKLHRAFHYSICQILRGVQFVTIYFQNIGEFNEIISQKNIIEVYVAVSKIEFMIFTDRNRHLLEQIQGIHFIEEFNLVAVNFQRSLVAPLRNNRGGVFFWVIYDIMDCEQEWTYWVLHHSITINFAGFFFTPNWNYQIIRLWRGNIFVGNLYCYLLSLLIISTDKYFAVRLLVYWILFVIGISTIYWNLVSLVCHFQRINMKLSNIEYLFEFDKVV